MIEKALGLSQANTYPNRLFAILFGFVTGSATE
jgi:hypothetical protein